MSVLKEREQSKRKDSVCVWQAKFCLHRVRREGAEESERETRLYSVIL